MNSLAQAFDHPLLRAVPWRQLALPILAFLVVAMMVLPLPPFLLDLLFTFNIAISLVVLMVAIYTKKPLEFAAFPTVLLVTTLLPFALDLFSGHPLSSGAAGAASLSMAQFLVIFTLSIMLGAVLTRFRFPAAYLLAGMFVSSLAHYFGGVVGRPDPAILFVGFSLTGTLVGARFTSIDRACFKKLMGASISSFFVSIFLAAAFSAVTAHLLSINFGQVFVAYAPGGVEAMAAMALSLNYDPAFVAMHHLYRIVLLIFLLPVFLKLAAKMGKRRVD